MKYATLVNARNYIIQYKEALSCLNIVAYEDEKETISAVIAELSDAIDHYGEEK